MAGAWPGHPRLPVQPSKAWMPGSSQIKSGHDGESGPTLSVGTLETPRSVPRSVFEQEGHLHRHAVLGDLALGDARLLLDHVEPSDAADRLARASEPFLAGAIQPLQPPPRSPPH